MRTIIPKDAVLVPKHAKRVFKGIIYDVYQWQQEMFDGSFETFEMLDRPDSVVALVVNDNKLLIQKQQQPNTGEFYSVPGGRHNVENETELEAAKRELLEESGLVCAHWQLIEVFQPTTHADRFVYVFVASDIVDQKEPELDAGEKISNIWMEYENVAELQRKGALDAFGTRALANISEINNLLDLQEYLQ